MVVPTIAFPLAGIPDVSKLCHRPGLLAVQFPEEAGIDCFAVSRYATVIDLEGVNNQLLMTGHQIDQRSEALRGVSVCAYVHMHRRSPGRIGLRASLPKPSAKLLEKLDVLIMQYRSDKFTTLALRARD